MIALALQDGGPGEARRFEGGVLHATFERAFAPGAPVRFVAELEDTTLALRGKTVGSKRREDGRFDVRLRLLSLRREERERLAAALGG